MSSNTPHDFKAWSHAVGVKNLQNFSTDAAIEIEKLDDDWDVETGVDGWSTPFKKYSSVYAITITLASGSSDNTLLSGLRLANENSTAGAGFFSWLSQDSRSLSKFSSRLCVIRKAPNMESKQSPSPVTWVLIAFEGEMFHGGRSAI